MSTWQYHAAFNGRMLVSITQGEGCERPGAVVDWFTQFGPRLEYRIVENVSSMGLNTTFRDQVKAVLNEDGIVFKGHTKGISHDGDPFRSWRENMAYGCLSDIPLVESKFREGYRTFCVFRSVSDQGSAVMGQDHGPCRTVWYGWHPPGAFYWFDPKFVPESFFSLPLHHYENEAFPCHIGPVETSFCVTPDNLNFHCATIDEYFRKLNTPIC